MAKFHRIAVVGHSFVSGFKGFVEKDKAVQKDLGFKDVEVLLHGVSGLSIPRFKELREEVVKFRPDVVFLMLGDNDISKYTNPEVLVNQLVKATEELRIWAGDCYIIDKLLDR